ncbi:uncharacterized protein Gasu_26680 [Galdieria sulphuraria]|uniref:Conserved oligomeric Golgi complex subunit 6 n=1 Tax=Galdieria sulphuraria TaxID=130081 RepID=M2W2H3_GALSU|nr:uncharacterized protein Gasu_26680 [Galdieria sulphuraria]EME29881.1 hypothetical protein Gasu_26680 [Galdieria sulphuraria]|eukprot:XP_005706401.1 hypothetical protein Gasu_26680 [Galdieria sulphuraria]
MEGSSILQQKAGRILQKYSLLEREKLGQQLEKIEQHLDFENVSQGGRGSNLQVPGGASLVKNTKRAIDEMEPVIIELNHLKQKVECISESCTSLERALMGKERDNRDFFKSVVQVKTIISEKEKKKKILERVNNLFFLKADEEDALEGPVTVEFFIAVQKLHTAASRSSKLVRDSNSPLGLELLEYYSNRKGLVLEKCYSFIRIRFESLQDFEVSNEELTLLQKAFSFLREQPALLDSCLQEVANVLRGKTLENFVEALTKDGLSSDSIQDVQRYTNDMLAFIHHAFASQYELLSTILGCVPSTLPSSNNEHDTQLADRGDSSFESSSHFSNNDELQRKILSVVSEGLCLPFHRRFEKAFSSRMTVIVLFKLSNLLEFYSQLFENFIGKDGAFVRTLLECSAQSMTYFFQVWKEKFDVVLENLPAVDEELSPPSFVYQCTSRLSDIMDTLDMSLLSDERKEGHAESILSFVIEHLKNFCFRLSQQLDSLNSKVFIINCLESVRVPLTKYRFAATKVESITREIDHHLDLYVEDVTKASLEQSGLLEKILRLESLSLKESTVYIASVPGMDAESIAIALKNFYMSILSGLEIEKLLNPSSSGKLSSTRMRSRVKIAISESLISAYDSLFALVNDPSNGYEEDITRRMGVVDTSYVRMALTT